MRGEDVLRWECGTPLWGVDGRLSEHNIVVVVAGAGCVLDLPFLSRIARRQRGDRALPGGPPLSLRPSEGAALGGLPPLRAVEPDPARGALGGGRGLRAPLPRYAAPGHNRSDRARPAVRRS